ncbi:MAG: hypothetical protein H6710_07195 [Myxococcales bacterium]|nr:hypothetical protein [Myxococcales bacterium]MCB9704717.1 hypothetical protein [Myxococcales bacterium]
MIPSFASRRALASLLALVVVGCRPPPPRSATPPAEAIPHTTVDATVGVRPAILGAQHREPTLADLEEGRTIAAVIYLVLSVPIDPTTISPEHLLVALDDGRRSRPARVLLTPASGLDENRTLVLAIARPEGAEVVRPLAVTITGPLFGIGGEPLSGLAAEVDPIDQPPRLLQAIRHEVAEGDPCEGHHQRIRTIWSVSIAGGEPLDLTAFAVTLTDGSRAHPVAVSDHRQEPGPMQGDDNVIDLCLDPSAAALRIAVDAGALRDLYGIATASADAPIARPPRGG